MGLKRFFIKKAYQGILIGSGILLGVRNYEFLQKIKSYTIDKYTPKSPLERKINNLEEFLIKSKINKNHDLNYEKILEPRESNENKEKIKEKENKQIKTYLEKQLIKYHIKIGEH